jgi:hypothetical protein
MVHEHQHHQMDDDGAPPVRDDHPDILPIRVGVAPEAKAEVAKDDPIVLKDQRREKPRHRDRRVGGDGSVNGPSRLILPDGSPVDELREMVGRGLVNHRGEAVTSLNWPNYLAWRKTKCRPRDLTRYLAPAPDMTEAIRDQYARQGWLEEIDQATHEFVGAVAVLGEMFIEHGVGVFFGELRDKLIDECGAIFFCGAWALDAWGFNPLTEADDLELVRVTDEDPAAQFAQILANHPPQAVLSNRKFISVLGGLLFNLMLAAQIAAGLTAHSFKKLKFQAREQDVQEQVGRIVSVLLHVNQILIIANSSVEEALRKNQRKLDARSTLGDGA